MIHSRSSNRGKSRFGLSISRMGLSKAVDPSKKNIHNIREKTRSNAYPKGFVYKPKVSEQFLEEWLDFPTDRTWVLLNVLTLPFIWLLHTNKAMAGLDPTTKTIRERMCNQTSILGTVAGLFLVCAIAGFLQPPRKLLLGDPALLCTV